MNRRKFVAGLGAAAWPLIAGAQQPEAARRIGILSPGGAELSDPTFAMLSAFLQGLQELGYKEGRNLTIDRQYANGSSDRLQVLAAELVRRKPDVIVALSTTAARPVKREIGRASC